MGGVDLVIRSTRVVTPTDEHPRDIHIAGEVIHALVDHGSTVPAGAELRDVGHGAVLPGLVDTHVHINEPGRTDWEGFASASRAALAGGITTLVDMPLNASPVTTTVAALEAKREAAKAAPCLTDHAFWGGIVPGNLAEIPALVNAGVPGFKCFMAPSGIDDFPHTTIADIRQALHALRESKLPLLVHAESPDVIDASQHALNENPRSYAAFRSSRPPESEIRAIQELVELAGQAPARIHIVHLSAAEGIKLIRGAAQAGRAITTETCPHYLAFAAEDIPDGSTIHKCAPPIRDRANQELLWQGLRNGDIRMIVSDHSPCSPALKRMDTGSFKDAWGGIASLQLGLPVVWTHAQRRGFKLSDVARWMATGPADFVFPSAKGRLAPGLDADLLVFDPEAALTVKADMLHHRHKVTPYIGQTLRGVVLETYVRGKRLYHRGAFPTIRPGVELRRHPKPQ